MEISNENNALRLTLLYHQNFLRVLQRLLAEKEKKSLHIIAAIPA